MVTENGYTLYCICQMLLIRYLADIAKYQPDPICRLTSNSNHWESLDQVWVDYKYFVLLYIYRSGVRYALSSCTWTLAQNVCVWGGGWGWWGVGIYPHISWVYLYSVISHVIWEWMKIRNWLLPNRGRIFTV